MTVRLMLSKITVGIGLNVIQFLYYNKHSVHLVYEVHIWPETRLFASEILLYPAVKPSLCSELAVIFKVRELRMLDFRIFC